MAYEVITLNLIPSGEVPVIHAAQFDKARPLMFALKLGDDDFDPSTYGLELQIRKVDNNIVTAAPASTSGNVVTFMSTEQMTACSGTNLGEIQITKDDLDIATLHFYLVVQRDVLAGGVSSASDIYNLTEQIAAIVPEVIGDDYYDKEEVDALIAEHTFDPTNYYDKSDVNTLLNAKANTSDLSAVAFSGDYNDLENKPTIPDMSDYYNKTEVDNKITSLYEINTVSGDIAHFIDGGDYIPVKSFECEIGSDGFSQATITVCGKNFFNEIYPSISTLKYMSIFVGKGTFTMSTDLPTRTDGFANLFFLANQVSSGADSALNGVYNNRPVTVTSTDGYVTIAYRYDEYNPENYHSQIELGNQVTAYEVYKGTSYTVSFDLSFNDGVLKYENGDWYIDVSGVITPITSNTRIKTISGENNIFSNTGTCEVEYFTEKSNGIAELIKAFM